MMFQGDVCDGKGRCSNWPEYLIEHYRRISGIDIIPGTLNVQLKTDYVLPPTCKRLFACEWPGDEDVLIAHCCVNGYPGVIIRTQGNNVCGGRVEPSILEIASDICFRDHFDLRTGDSVRVRVCGECLRTGATR